MENRETYENRSLPGPVAARSRQIQGLIQEGGRLAGLVKIEVSAGEVEQRFQLLRSISELPPQVRRFLIISGGFVKRFRSSLAEPFQPLGHQVCGAVAVVTCRRGLSYGC